MPWLAWVMVSVVGALLVNIYPLPPGLAWYRPQLLCLVVVFWLLHRPYHFGMLAAWLVGLLQDIVTFGVWGGHAFALVIVAYICQMSYRRLLSYSLTQQTVWIFVFIGIYQVFSNWMQGLMGYAIPTRYILVSTLITALFWPLLLLCAHRFRLASH